MCVRRNNNNAIDVIKSVIVKMEKYIVENLNREIFGNAG